MGNVQYVPFDEAVQLVIQYAQRLITAHSIDVDVGIQLEIFAEKFVLDTMDYCHRTNFPRTLVYTAAELAAKYIKDRYSDTHGPLKSLKENDVEFTWAVTDISPIGCISEKDFESIRTKLNLYRKVVWSNG